MSAPERSTRPCLVDFLQRFPLVELSGDRDSAIRQLLDQLVAESVLPAEVTEDVLQAVLRREELGSTHIGHGFAFPHTKRGDISSTVVIVGRSVEGLDWPGIGKRNRAHVVTLILSSSSRPGDHLRILEDASRVCYHTPLEHFLSASQEELIEIVTRLNSGGG